MGATLRIGGGSLAGFGLALEYRADALTHDDVGGQLARIKLAYELGRLEGDVEVLDRLEASDEEPWVSLRRELAYAPRP